MLLSACAPNAPAATERKAQTAPMTMKRTAVLFITLPSFLFQTCRDLQARIVAWLKMRADMNLEASRAFAGPGKLEEWKIGPPR